MFWSFLLANVFGQIMWPKFLAKFFGPILLVKLFGQPRPAIASQSRAKRCMSTETLPEHANTGCSEDSRSFSLRNRAMPHPRAYHRPLAGRGCARGYGVALGWLGANGRKKRKKKVRWSQTPAQTHEKKGRSATNTCTDTKKKQVLVVSGGGWRLVNGAWSGGPWVGPGIALTHA